MLKFIQVVTQLFSHWFREIKTRRRLNQLKKATRHFLKVSEKAKITLTNVHWQLLYINDVTEQRNVDPRRVSFSPKRI